jgi:hypothetical protein
LQNCGAQLVAFDRDVSKKLDALATRLKGVSEKMKEYFARANEINYFPEEDLDGGHRFQIHVTAYSGVGSGARFEVDIHEGTVEVISSAQRFDYGKDGMGKDIEDDASETGEANYYEDGKHVTGKNVEDDTSEANKADYAFEDIIEEEDDHPLPIFEALYLKAAVDDIDAATNEKALESTNGMACYSSLNMVTGVKVEKYMYMRLGKIHSRTRSPGRCGSREQDEEANEEMTARKNLVVKAILCLVRESFTTFRIMDGRDENVDDYEIARDYRIPKKFLKAKGWACRPRKGEMYGTKYIERFKAELFEFFKISSRDSDKKLGPAIMLERLQLAHPDLYTLPSFAEIQSFVSQCFNREKDGNSEEPIPNSTSRR